MQTLNNLETGGVIRGKINSNFAELATYYNSLAFNATYNTPSVNTFYLTTSEQHPAGLIKSLKVNAVVGGVLKCACLRKLAPSPTYKIIKHIDITVVAGVNTIEMNEIIDEPFHFAILPGVNIYTAPGTVGADYDLHYRSSVFGDADVWIVSAGRSHNIELSILTTGIQYEQARKKTGKTICLCGDSVTDFCNSVSSNGVQYIGYDVHINRRLKFTQIFNQGYSGIKLAQTGGFADTKIAGLPVSDMYAAMLGTNDFALATQSPIGTITDYFDNTGIATFYGALRVLVDGFYTKNPNALVVLFTPSHRDYSELNSWTSVNSNGNTLNDFAEAIRTVGKYTGIIVVDLLSDCQLNYKTFAKATYDNLHPNTLGYQFIAESFLRKMYSYL